jgi:hypothetical protein
LFGIHTTKVASGPNASLALDSIYGKAANNRIILNLVGEHDNNSFIIEPSRLNLKHRPCPTTVVVITVTIHSNGGFK